MADLTDIITNAVAEAGGGDNTLDTSADISVDNGVDNTPEVVESEVVVDPNEPAKEPDTSADITPELDAEGKPVEKPKVEEKPVAKTPEDAQFEKDLAELGIRPPKDGERENRLPHSRVKVMLGKYGKKLVERHTAALQAKDTEYAPLKTKSDEIDNVDRLIITDPDRYIGILATLHPDKYGKFVGAKAAGKVDEVKPNEALTALGPRPVADHKFEDGSMGYTPEQHDKLLDWVASKARIDAEQSIEKKFTDRFGPIEKAYKSVQDRNAQIPKVRAEIAQVYEAYGKDLVDKHESTIIAAMKADPRLNSRQAADKVLMPLLRADRQKVRDEVTAEMQARPAAARKSAPGSVTAGKTKESSGDPVTDAITNAVATLRGR